MELDSQIPASTLCLPTRLDHLEPVLAYTRALAAIAGFSEREQQELELAVEEVFTNIVQHGFENNGQETFQIVYELTASGIVIVFKEKGMPFDPAALPQYLPEQAAVNSKGLGTYLARKSVDDITFRYLGRHGKETRLVKHSQCRKTRIQAQPADQAPVEKHAVSGNYQIRVLQSEDAMPVARCAYRAYGYSYADHVYDPAQLVEQNNSGSLISLVVRADDCDEALGYGDLRLYGKIAEVESVFVNPEYRNTRVFHRLLLALADQSRSHKLFGHFCLSVTSHIITQKAARFMGAADCGILLGFMPQTEFKAMGVQSAHRVSVALAFAALEERPLVTIYPPVNHQAVVAKVYDALKVPCIIEPVAEPRLPQEATVYSLEIQSDMNIAILRLVTPGADADTILKEQVIHCCRQGLDVIYLYLDLEHHTAAALAASAEAAGFIFGGILPAGLDGRDTLILQYLNDISLDWDEIKLATPLAHELLSYIRQQSAAPQQSSLFNKAPL